MDRTAGQHAHRLPPAATALLPPPVHTQTHTVGDKLLEQVFNLKFMAKQLNRSAIKCEKDEKSERLKVKKAIEKGNTEGAKIYAQNAIRKKHEQLNYLKLASRLDAVVSRLDTQAKMSMVNRNMMAVTKNLEKALAANNLEKVRAGAVVLLSSWDGLLARIAGTPCQQAAGGGGGGR